MSNLFQSVQIQNNQNKETLLSSSTARTAQKTKSTKKTTNELADKRDDHQCYRLPDATTSTYINTTRRDRIIYVMIAKTITVKHVTFFFGYPIFVRF